MAIIEGIITFPLPKTKENRALVVFSLQLEL
jgi:hypothetical protein